MANKSKQKGTAAETRIVNYLLAAGITADRQPLRGNGDQGDIIVTPPPSSEHSHIILEVKAGKQTQNYSRLEKKFWLKQTKVEARNAGLKGYLVIAKYGANIKDYEVWSESGYHFWYLDEFVTSLGGVPQVFKGGVLVEEHQTHDGCSG